MKRLMTATLALSVIATAAGCKGGSGDDGPDAFFPPERVDELAHAVMLAEEDMPGTGWDVESTDNFDVEDNPAADTAFEMDPACAKFRDFEGIAWLLGDEEEGEVPAGRASIEWSKSTAASIPITVEVSVDIEETIGEVSDSWNFMRDNIDMREMNDCVVAVMNASFKADDDFAGGTVSVTRGTPSRVAPIDGTTMAFDLNMQFGQLDEDRVFEVYFFAYGNADVTVFFSSDADDLDPEIIEGALAAVVRKLETTEASVKAE